MKIRFIQVFILLIVLIVPSRTHPLFSRPYGSDNISSAANYDLPELFCANLISPLSLPSDSDAGPEKNFLSRGTINGFGLSDVSGDTDRQGKGINYTRLAIVGSALVATMTAVHIYQQNGWWKDNRAPFHFKEDLIYGLSVDKIGHFYGTDVIAYLARKSLLWANMPEEKALWYGAAGGLLFQTFTEMEDGFSAWGFDRVDWLCDLGGALWAPAQHYIPALRTFNIKMSYHPSDLLGNPGGIGFKGQKHIIIDDYEGQTFWLSMKIEDILPKSARSVWPDFLCLAIGYGARSVAAPDPHRVYFIAPDIDFTRLIPRSTWFLKTLGEALNFIHPPVPAVRISPSVIWYGIYF